MSSAHYVFTVLASASLAEFLVLHHMFERSALYPWEVGTPFSAQFVEVSARLLPSFFLLLLLARLTNQNAYFGASVHPGWRKSHSGI